MKTVDVTPSWSGIVPVYFLVMDQGSEEGKRIAQQEIKRMAQVADEYNTLIRKYNTLSEKDQKEINSKLGNIFDNSE